MPKRRSTIPFPQTLWELLRPKAKRAAKKKPESPTARRTKQGTAAAPSPGSMAARYLEIERRMLKTHGVRVRR